MSYDSYNMTQLPVKIQNGGLIFRVFSSLILHATFNLTAGMDSVAFFTLINFSDFKLTSFKSYTYTELDLDQSAIGNTSCDTCFIHHLSPNSVHS